MSTIAEEDGARFQFSIVKEEDGTVSIPNITEEEITLLEGKEAIIQYIRLDKVEAPVDSTDSPMSSEALGITAEMIAEAKTKAESGTAPDFDMSQFDGAMTSDQIGIDPEMLRKAREEAEQRDNSSFSGSVLEVVDEEEDEIAEGEFTEVSE